MKNYLKHINLIFCFGLAKDACFSSPCFNNAKCVNLQEPGKYKCECNRGFEGDKCQIPVDMCKQNPCKNNAKCYNFENGNYSCECVAGFSGFHCEIDFNECLSGPCLNGGSCVELKMGGYECKCPLFYSGQNCQVQSQNLYDDRCKNFCSANSTCVVRKILFLLKKKSKSKFGLHIFSNISQLDWSKQTEMCLQIGFLWRKMRKTFGKFVRRKSLYERWSVQIERQNKTSRMQLSTRYLKL